MELCVEIAFRLRRGVRTVWSMIDNRIYGDEIEEDSMVLRQNAPRETDVNADETTEPRDAIEEVLMTERTMLAQHNGCTEMKSSRVCASILIIEMLFISVLTNIFAERTAIQAREGLHPTIIRK